LYQVDPVAAMSPIRKIRAVPICRRKPNHRDCFMRSSAVFSSTAADGSIRLSSVTICTVAIIEAQVAGDVVAFDR
jgi:hypothetical protein